MPGSHPWGQVSLFLRKNLLINSTQAQPAPPLSAPARGPGEEVAVGPMSRLSLAFHQNPLLPRPQPSAPSVQEKNKLTIIFREYACFHLSTQKR